MKKLLFIFIAMPMLVWAQTTTQNYVKTTVYRDENGGNPSYNITYFDGLGRPVQKIANKQSGTSKDLVAHIEYDSIGRQKKDFLPYVSGQDDMSFIDPVLAALPDAIRGQYHSTFGDTIPYSEKRFEKSPLNRVLKQSAPGNDWAMGAGHEITFDYQTNDTLEVRLFRVGSNISFNNQGYYNPGELYKTITKNENWTAGNENTTEEFKDKEGYIILKKTYGASLVGNTLSSVPHETYYVYDDYGNLTFVLPPLVDTANSVTPAILDNLCYQYKYDQRNRLIQKKLPGKQWEYIAYNNQDMPVARGPVPNPFGGTNEGWLITKYDAFGRVVYTGWLAGSNFEQERATIESNITGAGWAEHFTDSTTTTIDNFDVSYTNDIDPKDITLLTVNYYDGYEYINAPATIPHTLEGQGVIEAKGLLTGSWKRALTNSSTPIGDTSYTFYSRESRPIRVHTDNYLGGVTQTDSKLDFTGKVLHTTTNHKRLNNDVVLTVRDDYTYTAEDRLEQHTQTINGGATETIAKNTYDALGQLIRKDVGGTATAYQKVDFKYNIRGWLLDINNVDSLQVQSDPKDLFAFHINYNQDVDHDGGHNIKPLYNGNIAETNWRTSTDNVLRRYGYEYDSMNRLTYALYQKPENSSNHIVTGMYDEQLQYDKNGNIQTLERNGDFDSDSYAAIQIDDLSYRYHPDNKNQLMKVTDASVSPKGFKDQLTDNAANNDGIIINDYSYDANGNLTSDDNKGITGITYNHLNLPVQINFANGNKIEYLYDAEGQKLRKTVYDGSNVLPVDYLDGFQYTNTILSFFPHAEGYVNATYCETCDDGEKYIFDYVYQYKDHLGNIRLNYGYNSKMGVKVLSENHYYPFGLKHSHYNSTEKKYEMDPNEETTIIKDVLNGAEVLNKYKFQEQEWQDELGLGWYNFKYRNYDPAVGRFISIDPLAEKYQYQTPYSFSENRVIDGRELEGLERFPVNGQEMTKPVANYLNSRSSGWKSFMKSIGDGLEKLDKAIASIPHDGKDNLQGNSQGHFKQGLDFFNNDKKDPKVNRGLETTNWGAEVKSADADFVELVEGGLGMSTKLETFDALVESVDKIVTVREKIKEEKEKSSESKLIKVSEEPKKPNQDYQNSTYVRQDQIKKDDKK